VSLREPPSLPMARLIAPDPRDLSSLIDQFAFTEAPHLASSVHESHFSVMSVLLCFAPLQKIRADSSLTQNACMRCSAIFARA